MDLYPDASTFLHKPKPRRSGKARKLTVGGVAVWHRPASDRLHGMGRSEPVTWLGPDLVIEGGEAAPITVRLELFVDHPDPRERRRVFDLTRATPDLGSHEAAVLFWAWVFGIGQDEKVAA